MAESEQASAAFPKAGENPIERALLDCVNQQAEPRSVVRELARLLETRHYDWRDLVRALDRIKAKATEPASRTQNAESQTISTASRVALLAMRRAMGAISQPSDPTPEIRLQHACSLEDGPETMLRKVFAVLREIVDFDIATYAEYETGKDEAPAPMVRARFAVDGSEAFRWPARWVEIDPEAVEWMKGRDLRIPDLDEFYKNKAWAKALRKNPVALEYKRRGALSVVNVSRIDGGQLLGAFSLARRKDKPAFSLDEQERLSSLYLDRVMRRASEGFQARQRQLAASISGLFEFDDETSTKAIARKVVDAIGQGFEWEYVAIFRVARAREQFEVVEQYDATGGKLSVKPDYSQPLEGDESGMIGKTRREGVALRARNVRPPRRGPKGWKSPHNYIRTNNAQASAMCVPVKLGNEVEWILDCECSQVDGFLQPDEDAIVALVKEIERTIRLWFESRLSNALLNWVDQGVVVVNEHQRIERLNASARKLLGCDTAIGRPLADFTGDGAARRLLDSRSSGFSVSGLQIPLRRADGRERFVLASAREPEDTFNRRIWLFSDLAEKQWVADLSHMRQTVQDVAAQARGPLLLANALVRQARRVFSNSGAVRLADDILERATRSLNKTDITYERLASSLEVISEPQRETRVAPFSVRSALKILSQSLPAEDEAALKLDVPSDLPEIQADPERMMFALRSIVGYLLSIRSPDATLVLRAWKSDDDRVSFRASLEAQAALPSESPLAPETSSDAAEKTATAAGQALTSARKIVESHGGQLLHRATDDGLEIDVADLLASSTSGASVS